MSSRYEGFPNVVLEALACGTPVIATPALGGIRGVLEELEDCLIAKSISVESLVEALSGFVYDKRLALNAADPYAIDGIPIFTSSNFKYNAALILLRFTPACLMMDTTLIYLTNHFPLSCEWDLNANFCLCGYVHVST